MEAFRTRLRRVRMHGGADVHVIENAAANNVPAMLRRLANDIESDLVEMQQIVAVIDTGNNIEVRGFGPMDGLHAIGLLQLGIQRLAGDTITMLDQN